MHERKRLVVSPPLDQAVLFVNQKGWQLLTRGRFSAAEMTEDEIQFALDGNVEDVPEEGG